MRRLAALLALAAALLAAGSCSRRDRLNPLDPLNPRSGGAPQGFNALADFGAVRLVWTARPDLAIDGFRLYRLAPFDSLYRPLGGLLPKTSSTLLDGSAINDFDFQYRLYFVVDGRLSVRFAADVATPGRVRAWVGDVTEAAGRLLRLAPDARDVLVAHPVPGRPFGVAVTQDSGPVWVADNENGSVQVIDPQNFAGPVIRGIPAPFGVALDPFDGSGWICDLEGSVRHYDADGTPGTPNALGVAILDPTGIATDPRTGDVWLVENSGGRIRRFTRDGTPVAGHTLQLPSRVAVDSLTGQAWATSGATGWVWRLSPGAAVLDSIRLTEPIGIALDWRRRTAWIADDVADALIAIDMDTRAERFRVGGLAGALDVAVDLERGEAWVVALRAASVSRISPTGTLLARVGGLGEPYVVRLDRGFQ